MLAARIAVPEKCLTLSRYRQLSALAPENSLAVRGHPQPSLLSSPLLRLLLVPCGQTQMRAFPESDSDRSIVYCPRHKVGRPYPAVWPSESTVCMESNVLHPSPLNLRAATGQTDEGPAVDCLGPDE